MEIVYALIGNIDYEANHLIGVFATKELAQLQQNKIESGECGDAFRYDSLEIYEEPVVTKTENLKTERKYINGDLKWK